MNTKEVRKQIKQLQKQLAETESYRKAGPAERRCIEARDVIAQLKAERYIASRGAYFNDIGEVEDSHSQMQPLLLQGAIKCEVCAKAGILASSIRFRNKCTVYEARGYEGGPIEGWPKRDLDLMEVAFEKRHTNINEVNQFDNYANSVTGKDTAAARVAVKFGKRFTNDTNRLIAIMQNVITNKGTFRP